MAPAAFASAMAERGQPKAATTREGFGQEDPQPVPSIKEEASSSSSSSDDNDASTSAAVRPLPDREPSSKAQAAGPSGNDAQPGTSLSVKTLVATTESHVQQEKARSTRELKLFTVAKGLMATAARSPRARSATTTNATTTNSTTTTTAVVTKAATAIPAFGKFRRANTTPKGELSRNLSLSVTAAQAVESTRQSPPAAEPKSTVAATKHQKTSSLVTVVHEARGDSEREHEERDQVASEDASGHDFVDDVRETLDQLITQLDSVDPKKLCAIRLGGELRGLLGKAQDEFGAYEEAFVEHAAQVGVSIALQNFSASLVQVFAIVARLQTAKPFLLNKKFKREVLFAFQEINSYYTSLFMELSMAVAKRSGLVLPLPSPVKPQAPEPVVEEEEVLPEPKVERIPEPPPKSMMVEICMPPLVLIGHVLIFAVGLFRRRITGASGGHDVSGGASVLLWPPEREEPQQGPAFVQGTHLYLSARCRSMSTGSLMCSLIVMISLASS